MTSPTVEPARFDIARCASGGIIIEQLHLRLPVAVEVLTELDALIGAIREIVEESRGEQQR